MKHNNFLNTNDNATIYRGDVINETVLVKNDDFSNFRVFKTKS